jgi:hypothetical protein
MKLHRLVIAAVLVVSTAALAQDQSPVVPAAELINAVVKNELSDRVQQRKWMYLIEKREGNQSTTEEQVETKNGPLYRVLALNGAPLNPDQRQQDEARIRRLLADGANVNRQEILNGKVPVPDSAQPLLDNIEKYAREAKRQK